MEKHGDINIQQIIKEAVAEIGPQVAREWGEELRRDREEYKKRQLNIHKLVKEKIEKDGEQIAKELNDDYERNKALLLKKETH